MLTVPHWAHVGLRFEPVRASHAQHSPTRSPTADGSRQRLEKTVLAAERVWHAEPPPRGVAKRRYRIACMRAASTICSGDGIGVVLLSV